MVSGLPGGSFDGDWHGRRDRAKVADYVLKEKAHFDRG